MTFDLGKAELYDLNRYVSSHIVCERGEVGRGEGWRLREETVREDEREERWRQGGEVERG